MKPKNIKKKLLAAVRPPRILVVRNDGLGDFILTLPLISSLKKQFPEARIHVLINNGLQLLIPILPDIEGAIIDEGILLKRHRSLFSKKEKMIRYKQLEMEIKAYSFDVAILPYAETTTAKLIHSAGIPIRIGPSRRSFFWRFNIHFKHSRRKSNKSEYSLNLQYLSNLGFRSDFIHPRISPYMVPKTIAKKGKSQNSKIVIIHPYKRATTALSWRVKDFVSLSSILLDAGFTVIAIGDVYDKKILTKMFKKLPAVQIEVEKTLRQLVELIQTCSIFIGNSSGPLHLAALMKRPHVGIFPKNHVSSSHRWKTFPIEGAPVRSSYLLQPENDKLCIQCERENCSYFNCVEDIKMESVLDAIEAWQISTKSTRKKKIVTSKKKPKNSNMKVKNTRKKKS